MPVFVPEREAELLAVIREEAQVRGVDPEHVERLFLSILEESRAEQRRERAAGAESG